ncbi:hypothetical protein [Alienimonas californiensis]|uniref:Uncharacterized protein n=1 Tax=Alienimonas californiensis TaxID=2527989 RepID=A0A517PDA8_9PLAN|nr:hypothetical protein [Alienimonas californiensis]QDT17364.1 hypothetical protein CA12_34850 [Alienimonas californiensis]
MSLEDTPPGSPSAPPVPVPDGWTAERDGGTLTLTSPDTCFWTFTALPGGPDPADAVDSAVAGLREEYEDFESEALATAPLAGGEAGLDAAFFCLDRTVSARVRAFREADVTYVLFYQGIDAEIEERRRELEALSKRAVRAVSGSADAGGASSLNAPPGSAPPFPAGLPR